MNISFKGYDATPLNAIYYEKSKYNDFFHDEMSEIAEQENFKIRRAPDELKWTQDYKTIIDSKKRPLMLVSWKVEEPYLKEVKKSFRLNHRVGKNYVTGGNCYIGKLPNGEKWMLVGEDEVEHQGKIPIAREYDIKPKNIFAVPQQNFHIDMFLRPIGYPYILVDNPELSLQKLQQMDWSGYGDEMETIEANFRAFEEERKHNYATNESVIEALQNAGFKPIQIAGVFGNGINFMNAIVNKHKDGTISYITNATRCKSNFISRFQEEFEKELREKVQNLDKVYFISGVRYDLSNTMMDTLNARGGGIHCMTTEEPNFKKWV